MTIEEEAEAEVARGALSTDFDPLYCVTRGVEGDVIVNWSQMTDAEREKAWRDYERAFGTAAEKEPK
jgi:hypothetical protein